MRRVSRSWQNCLEGPQDCPTEAPTAEYSAESPAEYSASRIFSRKFKMKADFAPERLQLKIFDCGHNRK